VSYASTKGYTAEHAKEISGRYGLVSPQSVHDHEQFSGRTPQQGRRIKTWP